MKGFSKKMPRTLAAMIALSLNTACVYLEEDMPPEASAKDTTGLEKSLIQIDASGSKNGSQQIVSYSLSLNDPQSKNRQVLTSSTALIPLTLPAVASTTTYHYTLTVVDLVGRSDSSPVDVRVEAIDEVPLANADSLWVASGQQYRSDDSLLDNDYDERDLALHSDALKAHLVSAPQHVAQFSVLPNGQVSFVAPTTYTDIQDTFSYRVSDGSGLFSEPVAVSLKIARESSALEKPTARAASVSGWEQSSLTIDASASSRGSFPIASYQLTPLSIPTSWNGRLPPSTVGRSPRFSLSAADLSQDAQLRFKLTVRDTRGNASETTVYANFKVRDELPTAGADSARIGVGDLLKVEDLKFSDGRLLNTPRGNLLLNDRDEADHSTPSANLSVELISLPRHASSFYVNKLGGYAYRSQANTTADQDSFSYRVKDASGASATTTVSIQLIPDPDTSDNSAPLAQSQCLALAAPGASFSGQLSELVSDSDDASFNFRLLNAPSHGRVDIDLSSGQYSYTPSDSGRGFADHFVYQVDDLNGGTASGVVSLVYGAARIMPLGDSITFGVEGYTSATGDLPIQNNATGYRKILRDRLSNAGYLVDFVGPARAGWDAGLSDADHAGFPGWRATELAYGRSSQPAAGNIDTWLNNHPADAVLVHAGTNDHTSNAATLQPLLNKIQQWSGNRHPLEMFVASIVEQRRDGGNPRAHLDAFNAGVQALVPNYSQATYVDQYSALNWQTDLSSYATDSVGLHPNSTGYQKMADRWYDAIMQSGVLNKCP